MDNLRELKLEARQLKSLKSMVKVYGELAAMRMNRAREDVLYSRKFLAKVTEVFDSVRISYAKQLKRLAKTRKFKKGEYATFLAHNGKTVAVFLSANTRLYGDIVQRTWKAFEQGVRENDAEATLVGKVAKQLYEKAFAGRPYTYFDFPDMDIDHEKLAKIMAHLVHYEEIHVYHGRFVNVIRQEADMYAISSQINLEEIEEKDQKRTLYIFEPSMEAILRYFEEEIFSVLFEQTVAEAQLAKFASRLVAMDRAEQNISDRVKELNVRRMMLTHRDKNRKQLNAVVSVMGRL